MADDEEIFSMPVSHVRAILGYACRDTARTGRPLGIRRYRALEVVLVPLAEWQRLKRLEAEVKDPGPAPGSGAAEGKEVDATR
jgi:hypothetical protein